MLPYSKNNFARQCFDKFWGIPLTIPLTSFILSFVSFSCMASVSEAPATWVFGLSNGMNPAPGAKGAGFNSQHKPRFFLLLFGSVFCLSKILYAIFCSNLQAAPVSMLLGTSVARAAGWVEFLLAS